MGNNEDILHEDLVSLVESGRLLAAWPEGTARYGDLTGNVHLLLAPGKGSMGTMTLPQEYMTDKIRHLFDIASTVNYHMLKAVKEAITARYEDAEDDFWV